MLGMVLADPRALLPLEARPAGQAQPGASQAGSAAAGTAAAGRQGGRGSKRQVGGWDFMTKKLPFTTGAAGARSHLIVPGVTA